MRIDIVTLFPRMFTGPFGESIVKRSVERGLIELATYNLRDYAHDKHRTVDDYSYGGESGMILKPEPLFEAVEAIRVEESPWVTLLTPQGRPFSQSIARELSRLPHLILICGHYEGVDERVREHLVNDEISIGDYVLSGGELAAMVIVDAVVRLLPGALGSETATQADSYSEGMLEYPQYTRPKIFRGWEVPQVLLLGNHEQIARWRREQAVRRTMDRRPDILEEEEG